MKKKYILFSILTLILASLISCSSAETGSNDEPETETETYTYKSSMKLRQESEITYVGTDTDFYKQVITYDTVTEEVSSVEKFDYSEFEESGVYSSTVSTDLEGKNVIEMSSAVIAGNDTDGYEKSIQYFKVNNGEKAEKPYLETLEAAEDKNFKRNTLRMVYSPSEGNAVKELSVRKYIDKKLYYEISFHTEGKIWDEEKTVKENYKGMDFNVISFNTFNEDGTLDRTTKFVCNPDPLINSDVSVVVECYNYDEKFFETNYVVKRTYSALLKNSYSAIFSDPSNPDMSVLDEMEELPSSYEGIKFTEYPTAPGSSDYVYYPATITTMNDEWEILYKKNYSYALMPGTTGEYYPKEEITWSKKAGEDTTTIILQKLSVVKKDYYLDSKGNLCLHHQLYISDAYYAGEEGSGSGTDWINN